MTHKGWCFVKHHTNKQTPSTHSLEMKGSGIAEIIIESGNCASGSLDRVMSGKHFKRALRVHKLVFGALERLLLERFEDHPRYVCLSKDAFNMLLDLIRNPATETTCKLKDSGEFKIYYEKYKAFISEALDDTHDKTVRFWSRYMHYSDHSYSYHN